MDKQNWYRINEDSESGENSPLQQTSSSSIVDQVVPPEASDTRNITLRTVNQSDIDLREDSNETSQLPRRLFGASSSELYDNSRPSIGNSSCHTSLTQHHLTELATQSGVSISHLKSNSSSTLNSQLSADSLIVTPHQKRVWFGLNEDSASDSGDEYLNRLSNGSTAQEISQHTINSSFHNTQYQTHLKYSTDSTDSGDEYLNRLSNGSTTQDISQHTINSTFHNTQYQTHLKYSTDSTYHEDLTQHQINSRPSLSSETRLTPVGSADPKNLTQYPANSSLTNSQDLTQHSNSVSLILPSDRTVEGALNGLRHSTGSSTVPGDITQHPWRSTLSRVTKGQTQQQQPTRAFEADLSEIVRPSSRSAFSSTQKTLNLTNPGSFGRFSEGSSGRVSLDVSKITFTRGQSGTLPSFQSQLLQSLSDSSKSSQNGSDADSQTFKANSDKFKETLLSYVSSDLSPREGSSLSETSSDRWSLAKTYSSENSNKSSPSSYYLLTPEQNSAVSDSSSCQTSQDISSTVSPVNSHLAEQTFAEKSHPKSKVHSSSSTRVSESVSKIPKLVSSLPKQKPDNSQQSVNKKINLSEVKADSLFRQTIVSGSSEFVKYKENCSCQKQKTSSKADVTVKCLSHIIEDQSSSSSKCKSSTKGESVPTDTKNHSIQAKLSTAKTQRTAPEGISDNSGQHFLPISRNTCTIKQQPLKAQNSDTEEKRPENALESLNRSTSLTLPNELAANLPSIRESLHYSKQKTVTDSQLEESVNSTKKPSVDKSNLSKSLNGESEKPEALYLTNQQPVLVSELTKSLYYLPRKPNGYSRQSLDSTQHVDISKYQKKPVVESNSQFTEVLNSPSEKSVDFDVTGSSYYPLSEDTCLSHNSTGTDQKMDVTERNDHQEVPAIAQVPNLSFNDSSKDSTSLQFSSPRGNHRYTSSDDDWRSETDGTTSEAEVGSPANPAYDQMMIGVSHEAVHEALSEILHHEAVNTVVSEISNDFVSGNLSMDGGRSSDSSQLSSDKEDGAIEKEFQGSISGLYPESYGGYSDVDWNIYTSNESDNNITPRSVASSGEREGPVGAYQSQNFKPLPLSDATIENINHTVAEDAQVYVVPRDTEQIVYAVGSASSIGSNKNVAEFTEQAVVEADHENQAAGDGQITQDTLNTTPPELIETQADPNSGDVQTVSGKELLPETQVCIAVCKKADETTKADLNHGPNLTQGYDDDQVDQDRESFETKPDQNDSTSSESGRGSGSKSASLSEDYNMTKHDETSYYSEFSRENSNVSDVMSTDGKPFTDADLKERLKNCEQDLVTEDSGLTSKTTNTLMGYTSEYITREERDQVLNSHNNEVAAHRISSLKDESSTSEMFAVMNKTFNSDLSMGTIAENARGASSQNGQNLSSRGNERVLANISDLESLPQNSNFYSLDRTDSSEFFTPASSKISAESTKASAESMRASMRTSGDHVIVSMPESVLVKYPDSDNQRPKSADGDTTDTESSTSTLKPDVVPIQSEKSNYEGVPLTKVDYENITADVSGRSSTPTLESQQPPALESFVPVIDFDTKDRYTSTLESQQTPALESFVPVIDLDKIDEKSSLQGSIIKTNEGFDWKSIHRPLAEKKGCFNDEQSLTSKSLYSPAEASSLSRPCDVLPGNIALSANQMPAIDNLSASSLPSTSYQHPKRDGTKGNLNSAETNVTFRDSSTLRKPNIPAYDDSAVSTSDDDGRSTDDLSRKVEHLLNNTAHLAEQAPRKHIEGISLTDHTSSPRDLDYDSLHRDLDEIQDRLKTSASVPKIDVENANLANSTLDTTSPKLSFRSACGTGSPTSMSDLDTSRRRFLWDYGADIGYDDGQSRFIGNIKDLTGSEVDRSLTHGREMSTANSSRSATPMFEPDRTNHTITGHNDSIQTEDESHSLVDADETLSEEGQEPVRNFSHIELFKARQELLLREALETERRCQTSTENKNGIAHRVNQLLEKEDPKKQAGDILRDISAEEKNFFRQMADGRRGYISNDSDNSSTTTPKIAQRKGIELSPRVHRSPAQENYYNSPTLQRILNKSSAANEEFGHNIFVSPNYSGYHSQAPSSSALSNAKTFLSGQLEKMSSRQFDQSIELRSPVRRVINCYPVFGSSSVGEGKDPERELIRPKHDQTNPVPEQNMRAVSDTGSTDNHHQSRPASQSVELVEEQPPSVRPTPTGASDIPPTQTSALNGAQKAMADSRALRGQASSDDYRSPNPGVVRIYSDWKSSPGNSDPNSSPSSFTTTSPSDSDYSGAKRQTQKFMPYRPVGSSEVYYTAGSETDDKVSVADSVTTMESTHPGSDDARGPDFPATALGSRPDVPKSQGVYGTRVKEPLPAATSLSTIEEKSQTDERDRSLSLENLQTDNHGSASEGSNKQTEELVPRERTDKNQEHDGPSPRTQAILDRVDQTLKDQGSRSNQSGLKVKGDDPEFQTAGHNDNRRKNRQGNNGENRVPKDSECNFRGDAMWRPSSNGRPSPNPATANLHPIQGEQYTDNITSLHDWSSANQRDLNRRERDLARTRTASEPITKVPQSEIIRGIHTNERTHFSLQGSVSEPIMPRTYTAENHARSYEELSFMSQDAARGSSSMVSHARSPMSLYHSPILSQQSAAYSPSTRHTDTRTNRRELPVENKEYVSVSERKTLLSRYSPLQVDDEEEDVNSRRPDDRMFEDRRMEQPRRSSPQTKLVEPYSQQVYHHKPRDSRALDRDSDMAELDRAPVSRMAGLLQESLQRDPEINSGLPANINVFWERFQQMQSDSDSSMDTNRLEALADLMRNPSKHVVKQYICGRETERRRREAWVEREREDRRREDKEQKRLTLSAKRQKIVDGSYSETLEESNGYSSERSRDDRGFRKHDQSPLKPYLRELSYDSSVIDTLYSIPEDPSIDLGNSMSTSSDTYQAAPKTSKRQRHVIDPHMQKLKSKISKQRVKYEKQKRKEAQRLAKIQHLEELLVAKKSGRISNKAFEKEMANLSSCTERTSSSEMSTEVSTMMTTRDSTDFTSVSSQLSSEQSTATSTPRSTSEDSTLTDMDWARVSCKVASRETRQRSEPNEPRRPRKDNFTSPTRPETKTRRENSKERLSPQRRKKTVDDPPFATQKVKYTRSSSSPQRSGKEKHRSEKSSKESERRTADVSVMYPSPQVSPKKKKGPKMVSLAVQTTPRLSEKSREKSVSRSPSPRSRHTVKSDRHHSKDEKTLRHRSASPKSHRSKSAENKPPKKNRRSLNDADLYNRSGISWYVPMDDSRPWRKPLKERQAYAMSHHPYARPEESAGVDWSSGTDPTLFQRRSYPSATEGDMMSEVESFMEMYLTKSRENEKQDKPRDLMEEKERPLSQMSLQEAFARYKATVMSRMKARQKRIMLASKERELQEILGAERAQLFRDHRYAEENNEYHPLSENLFKPKKRSMSKHEMKELTARLYYKLPEVLQKEVDKKRLADYKVNRIKAKLFNKKVQRKVLGKPVPWCG